MRKIHILLAVLLITTRIFSIPATPFPVKITQPDGSDINIRLHGDEFFNYKTTVDGYLVMENEAGILNYAKLDVNGKFISTALKANDIEKRSGIERKFVLTLQSNPDLSKTSQLQKIMRSKSTISSSGRQKAYPLTGTPKSLVILVNFSDIKFVTATPQTAYSNLLNQSGYATNSGTGSAKDYFHDASTGIFNPQFDVIGPVTLDNTMAFYGANDANGNDVNPQQMVIDACTKAAGLVDFSQYDTDKNGIVDNVFIYYAGYNEAEGGPLNSIWPHKWNLNDYNTKFNGVSIFHYACTSELRGNNGSNMCGIGTFCHEFGHVIGLDDYYVTSGTDHHTLSVWNIMDYGAYLNYGRTPPTYCAYDRYFLSWLVPTELKVAGDYTLTNLGTSNKAYLISASGNRNLLANDATSPEYFLLENRQLTGWDKYLYGHGMIVYHIFYNPTTWASNGPNNDPNAMGVDIVEADGIAITETTSLDPTLSGDPYPGTANVTAFNPILRNGTNLKKPLVSIGETNGIIQFHFASNITLIQNILAYKTVQGTPSAVQIATISGTKLKSPINLAFKSGVQFEMKKESDPSTAWSKTITLIPVDSTVTTTNIQIRYNPTVPSYHDIHYDTFIASTISGDYADASISGTSTRPVYVVAPVATEATNNSFTGFVANWNSVSDSIGKAAKYYLTVYNLSEGQSSTKQTFDNGITAPAGWSITASGISNSAVYSGDNPPSLQFQNTGEFLQTEKFILPLTSLSFYIRSMGAYNGGFLVQALNNQNVWEKLDSISVSTTLNEKNKSYTFPESKGFNCFRFTYYKGVGPITFDDVTVGSPKQINYVQQDVWVTSNTDTLSNLIPGTEYFYKIKASDKSIHYENITDFSNTISVLTTAYPYKTKLVVKVEKTGDVTVYLPTVQTTLYIYNLLGQTIRTIIPTGTVIKLGDLPKNEVYILKAGNLITKIAI